MYSCSPHTHASRTLTHSGRSDSLNWDGQSDKPGHVWAMSRWNPSMWHTHNKNIKLARDTADCVEDHFKFSVQSVCRALRLPQGNPWPPVSSPQHGAHFTEWIMPYHGMASGTVHLVGFIIAFYFSLAAIDNYSSCTSYIICTAALKGKIEGPIVRNLLQTSNKGTPLPSFFFYFIFYFLWWYFLFGHFYLHQGGCVLCSVTVSAF